MITEHTLGVRLTYEAQQRALDEGYTLGAYVGGPFRGQYVIGSRFPAPRNRVLRCLEAAMSVFGFSREAMLGKGQYRTIFEARAAGMWAARQLRFSSPLIGRRFNRDESSVRNACRRCADMQSRDMGYRIACERVLKMAEAG